jgi:hypothetical protein
VLASQSWISLAPPSLTLPPEFIPACGHPGTQVSITQALPVTVPRAACDLTGVVLSHGSATLSVPTSGRSGVVTSGVGETNNALIITVDPSSGDVSIGPP